MTFKRLLTTILLTISFLMPISSPAQSETPFCVANLGEFAVHQSNKPRFGTPITTGPDGSIYIVYIQPDLKTVIRQYNPTTKQWSSPTTLTDKTQNDPYHNQPSVGIDVDGFIHAVYNHHNTPWQYKLSEKPHNIAVMQFKGQDAGSNPGTGDPAKSKCEGECRDNWLKNEPNIALIPGNQITYPTFGNHVDGTLFIAHRECLYCDKDFHDRQWSMGMSKFDSNNKQWHRVGDVRPWATTPERLPVGLKIVGDYSGRMHTSFVWCNKYTESEGGAACFEHPNFVSYAFSGDHGKTWKQSNNEVMGLPLTYESSERVIGPEWFDQANSPGYYAGTTTLSVDNKKQPTITVYPENANSERNITKGPVLKTSEGWSETPKDLANSPGLTYRDAQSRWIAVSSGLRIHISTDNMTTWQVYPIDLEKGTFVFAHDSLWLLRTGQLRLYAHSEDNKLIIYSLTFLPQGNCVEDTQQSVAKRDITHFFDYLVKIYELYKRAHK